MNPRAFVVDKEESLVPNDRAAKRSSELMLFIRCFGLVWRFEISSRIKGIITQKLPGAPMELISARLCSRIDDGSTTPSKLRRIVRGLDLELGDRVWAALHRDIAVIVGVVVNAIKDEVILVASSSVDREIPARIPVGWRAAAIDRPFGDLGYP